MQFFYTKSIDSTNSALKRVLALPEKRPPLLEEALCASLVSAEQLGAKHNILALLAYEQTRGYGRRGNTWTSPQGGCYVSLAFPLRAKPPLDPRISLGFALAAHAVLSQELAQEAELRIKWPNDLFVVRSKLAGISLECVGDHLLLGIGVNVFRPQTRQDNTQSEYKLAYLEDSLGDAACYNTQSSKQEYIVHLARKLASSFEETWNAWGSEYWDECHQALNHQLAFKHEPIVLEDRQGKPLAQGTVVGVDTSGCLCLQETEGTLSLWSSGEVHMRFKA